MSNWMSFLLGAVAGFFINKILESITSAITNKLKERNFKKKLKVIESVDERYNIITLASGVPKYNLQKGITISNSQKNFYIGFPEDMKHLLKKDMIFYKDTSFNGESTYDDIVKQTGIDNLVELIEKYRYKVANDFINGSNGCKFNGEKFGVYSIDATNRIGKDEEPCLDIEVFRTDYFTHKVFREIYKELVGECHEISSVRDISSMKKYNVFNTSIGVNGIVKVNSKEGKRSLLLTKRSKNVTTTNDKEWYSTSFIEAVSQTDYNEEKNNVSIVTTVKRGMEEELGIPQSGYYLDNNIEIYDVFLDKEYYEIGITCSVVLEDSKLFERDVKDLPAKDKHLETSDVFVLKNDRNSLDEFLKNKNSQIYSRSAYTLHSVGIREYLRKLSI